ncbi:FAD-binding protein [bacterium]|nr:FAD-binding protein [bacterium]
MDWKEQLEKLIGRDKVSTKSEDLTKNASDYTENLAYLPEIVVWPENTEDVQSIMKFCSDHHISLTARGAGTGLSAGSLPVAGGVSLDMSKMNRIIEIDEDNMQATVEPGVINEDFRQAVEARGLFYPPDPASKGSCFLGGNVAHSSGGPKALKYGTTKDYVINLEVVLATGEAIWTGSNTLKNSTGYNLTQLFVGSEGTLGIITKIVFRLIALPQKNALMLASFTDAVTACKAVSSILQQGLQPSALEFMERSAVDIAVKYQDQISFETKDEIDAYLLIEVDGNEEELIFKECEGIHEVLEQFGVSDVLFADSADQKEKLWKIRRSIGEMVKAHSIYKEEDTVVKRFHLPELLSGVKEIGKTYGFTSICYGHAGDGNLHVNIIKENMSDEEWNGAKLEEGIREIFRLCKKLGGTISGEHGIGLVQKKYMNEVMSETHIQLLRNIKNTFDPLGILNPGKIFPDLGLETT